jgi:hypothetical protein
MISLANLDKPQQATHLTSINGGFRQAPVRGKTGDRRAEAGWIPMWNHSRPDLHGCIGDIIKDN